MKTGWYANGDGWIRVLNNNSVVTAGEIRGQTMRSLGETVSHGRLSTYGNLYLGTEAAEGAGCPVHGEVSRNYAGVLLTCQYGVWRGTADTAVKDVNGYTRLSSGLIIQWGSLYYSPSGSFFNGSGWLSTPFPNACLNISGSGNSNTVNNPGASGANDIIVFPGCYTNSFTFRLDSNERGADLGGTHILRWIAIGY